MMMGDVAPEAQWFADLPLSDKRCNNDSCKAFEEAHTTSQAQISWASQLFYGHYILWMFAVIIFLPAVHFFIQSFIPQGPGTKEGPRVVDKVAPLIRLWSYRRLKGRLANYISLPSLGVAVIVVFCWAASTALSFAQHPYYRGKRGYGSPPLGVRTGLMAFALVPLAFATAGKANLITLITGLGHEKLNTFHRWVGYLMLYLAVIHTIPFIYQPLHEGGIKALRGKFYKPDSLEYNGTPTLGMLVGLAVLSIPPLRRFAYELFVQVHILMAIVFLGLCFWHADNLLDSWAYLWATLGIYLVQILMRWFGKTSTFKLRDRWLQQCPVILTKLEENMLRLEVEVDGRLAWEPGQHVFLRFTRLRPLDNHPFTIANIVDTDRKARQPSNLVFYIRPQRGLTARLASVAESGKQLSVTVDGPYGTIIRPKVERRYDTAILVAGGGGFSGMLPWLQHLAKHISHGDTVIKSVSLIWAVRKQASISWAQAELQEAMCLAPPGVSVSIWVTDEQAASSTISHEKSGEIGSRSTGSRDSTDFLPTLHFGRRPCISELVPQMMSSGRTIVLGCGPESLKTDLSNAVAGLQSKVLKGSAKELRLHTETFGW